MLETTNLRNFKNYSKMSITLAIAFVVNIHTV